MFGVSDEPKNTGPLMSDLPAVTSSNRKIDTSAFDSLSPSTTSIPRQQQQQQQQRQNKPIASSYQSKPLNQMTGKFFFIFFDCKKIVQEEYPKVTRVPN